MAEEDWTKKIDITEIVLIRHAESFNNVLYDVIREKYGSHVSEDFLEKEETRLRQADSELSERGASQVSMLGQYIKSGLFNEILETPDFSDYIVLSSPMKRCLLTSQALSLNMEKSVYIKHNLYESGGCYKANEFGSIVVGTGSKKSDIESEFPNYYCLPGMENGWYSEHTIMENYAKFQDRAKDIVNWLWSIHNTPVNERFVLTSEGDKISFKHVIMVIHGNLLNAVISGLQMSNGLITHNNTGMKKCTLFVWL
jgi:broad specificity phosphatase PhoE